MDNKEVIQSLRDGFEEVDGNYTNSSLVFAYNGTGKTRLSYEFAHDGREEGSPHHTLYYNAYTEDLFTWDNDFENETDNRQHRLNINKKSALIQGLAGYNFSESLHKYLGVFTDIDFELKYNTDEIPDYVVFSKKNQYWKELNGEMVLIDGDPIEYIKISRGEERLFVWCFFRCIMDQVLNGNEAYKDIKFIYIDDPMSSLDDNNVIAFAQQLYSVIAERLKSERSDFKAGKDVRRIKFVISSHHALFFHVMVHGLDKDKNKYAGCYYLHRNREKDELTLKRMGDDTPFYYNVAVMSEIKKAIEDDKKYGNKLFTYHFTIMRSVMEKIAEFFGHFDFRYILDGIVYKGNKFEEAAFSKGELTELYSRIVNVFSHQGSFFAPKEMNEDNKDSLITLFNHIKNKYRFVLPHLDDERSERDIVIANRNQR